MRDGGGGTREQCGSNKRCTGSPFLGSLKNLTTGLIWLGGDGGGVGRWSMEATKGALVPFWDPLKT